MQTLYHHIHNVTGKKYLGQTTRDLNVYKGSSVEWLEHLEQYGDDYSTEILFESSDKEKFKEDLSPLDPSTDCYVSKEFTKSYLRHLIMARESLAGVLLTLHNLRFFVELMEKARERIVNGTFSGWSAEWIAHYQSGK